MCYDCYSFPCEDRCPNVPKKEYQVICGECEDGLCVDEKYIEIEGESICEACLDEMTRFELAKRLGYEAKVVDHE